MLGDDQKDATNQAAGTPPANVVAPTQTDGSLLGAPLNMSSPTADATAAPISEPTSAPTTDAPAEPPEQPAPDQPDPEPEPAKTDEDAPDLAQATDLLSKGDDSAATPAVLNDADQQNLLDIKKKALTELSPLVGHLDQTPEEKFRTTMMMIQAADNQSLVKDAYEAAEQIKDEKERAQALLDVINEINYFTHPANKEDEDSDADEESV